MRVYTKLSAALPPVNWRNNLGAANLSDLDYTGELVKLVKSACYIYNVETTSLLLMLGTMIFPRFRILCIRFDWESLISIC